MTKLETDLIGGSFNDQRFIVIGKQAVQLKHCLTRKDQFLTRQITFDLHACISQTMAICGYCTQLVAFNQQQQPVEVVAHILGSH